MTKQTLPHGFRDSLVGLVLLGIICPDETSELCRRLKIEIPSLSYAVNVMSYPERLAATGIEGQIDESRLSKIAEKISDMKQRLGAEIEQLIKDIK